MRMAKLDIDMVRRLLNYNPDTGVFTWRPRGRGVCKNERGRNIFNSLYAGKEAGSLSGTGHLTIGINRTQYLAHRIAWMWMTGKFPDYQIDHINGVPTDNRWCNLRDVKPAENMRNQSVRLDNKSGVGGVWFSLGHKKWMAYGSKDGKKIHLGITPDFFEACCIRKSWESENGYHKNHGRLGGE